MIRLRTLGECTIEIGTESFTPDADVLFAALVYLTAERGKQIPRQKVAALLWPDHEPTRARHNLRQLLYRLRMSGIATEGGRETLMLPERLVAPTFSAAPAAERLVAERAAGTLVIGPFLPGYSPHFSDPYAEWLDHARSALDTRVRRVLLEVAHAHKLRGEWDHVDVLAAEVLRIDPLNEEATFIRAEATAMVGAKTEAVAMLDRFMEELGPERAQLQLPAAVLRKRIAERFPAPRYGGAADQVFVGRAEIMETLSTALLRARRGEGTGIVLVGPPGIGKTRVVHELTKIAAMQGVRVVRVTTVESDVERPLSAFTEAVPQLRALPGAIGVSPEALSFLDRLTDVQPSATTDDAQTDPRWIATRIRQSIVDLCDSVAAEGTILLAIEDVHWLDPISWDVLAALLEGIARKRLVLVLTSRGPHPRPTTPQRCIEKLTAYTLLPLTPQASEHFARAILADRGSTVSHETLLWCVSVGEGSPLYLRELTAHCAEGGAIGSVPPSLHGLLDTRISRLAATARSVLEAATVLDEFATTETLQQVVELPAHELMQALSELTSAQLLDDSGTAVRVRHALIGARVISLLAPSVARLLHSRAAAVLSMKTGESAVQTLLSAASHWRAAGQETRAVTMLIEAASAVERIGALRDAISLLEAARHNATDLDQRAAVLRTLVRLLILDNEPNKAATEATELRLAASPRASPASRAQDELLALSAERRVQFDQTLLMQRSFDLAKDTALPAKLRLSAARDGLIMALFSNSPFDHAILTPHLESVDDADAELASERCSLRVIYHANYGSLKIAVDTAHRLRALAMETADSLRRLSYLSNVGHAFYNAGLTEDALAEFRRLLPEARRLGSREFEAQAVLGLLGIAAESGDLSEAQRWVTEALTLNWERSPRLRELFLVGMARTLLLEERYIEAERLAAQLLKNARQPFLEQWHLRELLTLMAEVYLCVDRGMPPSEVVAELLECHARMKHSSCHDRTAAALILCLSRTGSAELAQALEREFVTTHRRSLVAWTSPGEVLGFPSLGRDGHKGSK